MSVEFTAIKRINALAEFERNGIIYKALGENEVSVHCPSHEDKNPSCHVNVKKNTWKCWVCDAKGDIVKLLALFLQTTRSTVLVDLSTRYNLEDVKTLSSEVVEKYHKSIQQAGPLLRELKERGIRDEDIRVARLGFDKGRITIPVQDAEGRTLDILRYLPGAPEKKFLHTRGYSKMRLYREGDLRFDTVWILGGPLKALAAGERLNAHGIGAVASSANEKAWDPAWNPRFKDKIVYLCGDVDSTGVFSSNFIAGQVSSYAKAVYIIGLPLDKQKYPKGDVNDYIGQEGAETAELLALQEKATPFDTPKAVATSEKGIRKIKLAQVPDPSNVGWRLLFDAVAAAIDETPYLVPKDVRVSCDRAQLFCHLCPVKLEEPDERGTVPMRVPKSSSAILALVGASEAQQAKALKTGLGIPRCKTFEFRPETHYKVTDLRLTPQLTISGQGSGSLMQPAFMVDSTLDLNTPYEFEGKVYPHPETQKATLVLDSAEETVDSLSTFTTTETEREELKIFRPSSDWTKQSIAEKLKDIYDDLAANVTKIYDRLDMHLVFDLTYHAPLFLDFAGRKINGWVNTLIAGDSAQGKTETFVNLQSHYGLGERVECKNATVAGLLGGLQQLGNRWFVSWGVIPTHDRRLVALEEVKGAPVEVIGKLTDMRSSGIAEIPKIERRRAHARTRLVFISNPRGSRPVAAHSFGVEIFANLAGSPEDLRRFDIAIAVAAGEVSAEIVHEKREAEHKYSSELCRRLILWSWTREREQVEFEESALSEIRSASLKLCRAYSELLPLVDRGTIGHKLARLSAALAARTFSTDSALEKIKVRKGHVEVIVDLIERSYNNPFVAYDRFSNAQKSLDTIRDAPKVRRYIVNQPMARSFADGLLHTDEITQYDIQDWLEKDRDGAQGVLSFLVRHHAIRRVKRGAYNKTGNFIKLLREIMEEKLTDDDDMFEDKEL